MHCDNNKCYTLTFGYPNLDQTSQNKPALSAEIV